MATDEIRTAMEQILQSYPRERRLQARMMEDRAPPQPSETSSDTNSWSIFKVPHRIRQANKNAYEPRLISIGPYHHGKEHLRQMEYIKFDCFRRINEGSKHRVVMAIKDMEEDVRKCYAEALNHIDSNAFVSMMILDGCFIVDLFQNKNPKVHFLGLRGILTEIYYDLLLLENQLPFSVLSKLYGIIENKSDVERLDKLFAESALPRLSGMVPGPKLRFPKEFPDNIKHLLGLVHDCWISHSTATRVQGQGTFSKFIRCATELEEAGIKFVKKDIDQVETDKNGSLFDIEFTDDAELKIPILGIQDDTERILRNFMAYEQFIPSGEPTYVCDYVKFMDNLIDSGKDVQLLRHSGVIVNWLGDDEAVALMFNKLCDFIYTSSKTFSYKEIYEKVDGHCQRRWNVWKAKLKKDYFNSPWSLISVIAAVVLLLLTMVQTIFSVLSYVHPK